MAPWRRRSACAACRRYLPQNPTYQAKQELGRLEDAGVKENAPAEYCAAELRVAYADQVVDIAALVDRLPDDL